MKLNALLDTLFPAGHDVAVHGQALTGSAKTSRGPVTVLGTTDGAAIDHDIALTLADCILATLDRHPGRPLVFLVDTTGQALSRQQELLCLNGTLAHLAQCVDLARRLGHPSVALVTEQAVSGGFLSFGLMADRTYALADAQVRVMDLKAMARVTKIAHERLVELAGNSPIFAPGPENYLRMGAIAAIWPQASAALLEQALADLGESGDLANSANASDDRRMALGQQRGGRQLAAEVAAAVGTAP